MKSAIQSSTSVLWSSLRRRSTKEVVLPSKLDGYLFIGLQYEQSYDQDDRGIFIPLNIMNTFVPYHFVKLPNKASIHRLSFRRNEI